MKHDYQWYVRRQQSIRQGIVIVVVVVFASALFAGAIRLMTRTTPAPLAAESPSTVQNDDDYEDIPASEDNSGE